jgi:VCBS repeat-containing protein
MRLRGGYITGFGGQSSVTDFYNMSTISGYGTIGADFGWAGFLNDAGYIVFHNEAGGLVNADVADQTLTIHTQLSEFNPVYNDGIMQASNGAHLLFSGGWVEQTEDGEIRALNASTVTFDQAILEGGTLMTEGTGIINFTGSNPGVYDVDITEGSHVTFFAGGSHGVTLGGTIDNSGFMDAKGFNTIVRISTEGLTLTGGGSLGLFGNYYTGHIVAEGPGAVLNNVDNDIHGDGEIVGTQLTVVNSGTITADDAEATYNTFRIEVGSLTNTGSLRAFDGTTLLLLNPVDGAVQNAGGTILADGEGSRVEISATIAGGTFQTTDGGRIVAGQLIMDGTTDAVTNEGIVEVLYSGYLGLRGDIINSGAFNLVGRNHIVLSGDTTLSGGGAITLQDGFETSTITTGVTGAELVNVDNRISGSGQIGSTYYYGVMNGLQLINGAGGSIVADRSGEILLVRTGVTITNNGVFQADGGILTLKDHIIGSGIINVTNGGTVIIDSDVDADVSFSGDSHDVLQLYKDGADETYDFSISGMGVGDRIQLQRYGDEGTVNDFVLTYTDDGADLTGIFDYRYGETLHLEGEYSEGQFRLIAGADGWFDFVRVETQDGTAGNNTLTADAEGERVIGLRGDDTLFGGIGNDLLDGSRGSDTVDYAFATSGVDVNLAVTTGQGVGGGQGTDRLLSIENLSGSIYDDRFAGNAADNTFNGRGGADRFYGGGGFDTMTGGNGADSFIIRHDYGYDGDVTVTDFTIGSDKIGTEGYAAIQTLADIEALVVSPANTDTAVLQFQRPFGQTTTVRLVDVDWRDLGVNDFRRFNNTAPDFYTQSSLDVQENADTDNALVEIDAADNERDALSYSLTGTDAEFFRISNSGVLRFIGSPNFENPEDANQDNIYRIVLNVSDGDETTSKNLDVTVTNRNEKPTITGGATHALAVDENVTGSIYRVLAADPDAGSNLSYSIQNVEGFFNFEIDQQGNLSFQNRPDFENPYDFNLDNKYQVVVAVTDGTNSVTQTIDVTVENVNDKPVIETGFGQDVARHSVHENYKGIVGSVGASDPDGDQLTYSLVRGDDSARFVLTNNGLLTLKAPLDFERRMDADRDGFYEVTVQVSDGVNTDRQTLLFSVLDRNEAPEITSHGGRPATMTFKENKKAETRITADDPDRGEKLVYKIMGGADKGDFRIDQRTGELSLKGKADFERPTDSNKDNIYKVVVGVTDGSFTDTQSLTFKVQNVGEKKQKKAIDHDDSRDDHFDFGKGHDKKYDAFDHGDAPAHAAVHVPDFDAGWHALL